MHDPRLLISNVAAPGARAFPGGGTSLSLITLHLARCETYPHGNRRYGYQILAPRDASGHIDATAWSASRMGCLVRRFREGEEDRQGRLVHKRGGKGGATWWFDYGGTPTLSEVARDLQDHLFSIGEYVSVSGPDGGPDTFKVADVVRLPRHQTGSRQHP